MADAADVIRLTGREVDRRDAREVVRLADARADALRVRCAALEAEVRELTETALRCLSAALVRADERREELAR